MHTVKKYYCPLCNNIEEHGTNHNGEIYCLCKCCGNVGLYCVENDFDTSPFIEANLISFDFRFDCSRSHREHYTETMCSKCFNSKQEWEALKIKLTGVKKFKANISFKYFTKLVENNGNTVKLYNHTQFEDQFVSNIGRLHRWFLANFPNEKIKAGYYLEIK